MNEDWTLNRSGISSTRVNVISSPKAGRVNVAKMGGDNGRYLTCPITMLTKEPTDA